MSVLSLLAGQFLTRLQEMLSGNVPFASLRNDLGVSINVTNKQRPTRDILPTHSDDIWKIINECWAHEPNDRPSTGAVLRSVREATIQRPSLTASTEATPVETIENSF